MFLDTLGYETDTYYIRRELYGEIQELGTEELGFLKSIGKFFKKVFRGVKKIVRKPLKIIRRIGKGIWKGAKKIATKAWKLVRRNKRTLATAGLVMASTAVPLLAPVATEMAVNQASNILSRYLPVGRYTYSGTPRAEQPQLIDTPPEPAFTSFQQTTTPYPYTYSYQEPNLGKALIPLGMLLATLFFFRR